MGYVFEVYTYQLHIEIINLLIKPPNPVVDLEYLPNEMFHDMNDGKISIVDVRCLDSMKQQFIIEMQLVHPNPIRISSYTK
jgi:hypothetical protein